MLKNSNFKKLLSESFYDSVHVQYGFAPSPAPQVLLLVVTCLFSVQVGALRQ